MKKGNRFTLIFILISVYVFGRMDISDKSGDINYKKNVPIDTNHVFVKVDSTAKYQNGNDDLISYVMDNFMYPKEGENQTSCIVKFTVSRQGVITNVSIHNKTPDKYTLVDKELIRVFLTMPVWKPAIRENTVVKQEFIMPIKWEN